MLTPRLTASLMLAGLCIHAVADDAKQNWIKVDLKRTDGMTHALLTRAGEPAKLSYAGWLVSVVPSLDANRQITLQLSESQSISTKPGQAQTLATPLHAIEVKATLLSDDEASALIQSSHPQS